MSDKSFVKKNSTNFKVKIKLASSEEIKSWTSGAVTESETLNYRTLKPVNGGLFCAQVFGPMNDYECLCKRYKGYKYDGIICERCNVQVTSASVRSERMGYIQLPVPVIHPWFFRNNNKIAALLDISLKDLKKIVNLEKYLVLEPGTTSFKKGDLITIFEYESNLYFDGFIAETGATSLKKLLSEIDIEEKLQNVKDLLSKNSSILLKKKYIQLIELCEGMLSSEVKPENMIIDTISVIPPDLRPLLEIEGGKFVSSDINELYRVVIYRVKRLDSLIKNQIIIPLILHNEIRMLQDGVNKLFGYGVDDQKDSVKKYKSLEDRIKGKEGSLRKSMLGKRTDYSGRTVIVIDPTLKLDECLVPKEMALEILKPSLIGHLRFYGLASSIKQAKRLIDMRKPEIWDILNEIIKKEFPVVLLNRAPTLHRVGIMAFKFKIGDKKCLGIPPLSCVAFNADFDGDQMAVHLPLSAEAQAEALMLMTPSKNLGSATHGGLLIGAFKDMALGLYAISVASGKKTDYIIHNNAHMEYLIMEHKVEINDFVKYLIPQKHGYEHIETTPGRIFLWNIIPKHEDLKFEDMNREFNASDIHNLMKRIRLLCGDDALSKFADDMKALGFKYANYYTGSLGKDDFFEIDGGDELIDKTIKKQIDFNLMYEDGLMTDAEMRKKCDDLWKSTKAEGQKKMEEVIKKNPFNPMVLITKSGARGSINQMLQILFMKGNVVDINGEFSIIPIWNGHLKGLTMDQYFLASYGARKTTTDVALKTAESGYLTRRLVDVAHDCVVNEIDCETKKYIIAKNSFRNGVLQNTVYDQILKRTAALDIKNPSNGKILVAKNTLINEDIVELLKLHDVTEVPIRSPTLCELNRGVCVHCYGGDLSSINEFVSLGESVGVIAAQSIGEPGTQLTMSKQTGGVAKFGSIESECKSPFDGTVYFSGERCVKNENGEQINISRDFKIFIRNKFDLILANFDIPYGAKILVKEKDKIQAEDILAVWKSEVPIIAGFDGICKFSNLQRGINYEDTINEQTGKTQKITLQHRQTPFLTIKSLKDGFEMTYFLPPNTILNIDDGDKIKAGAVAAYTLQSAEIVDIVGGLQKVVSLLENRPPNKISILSKFEGQVKIQNDKKGKNLVIITDKEGQDHEIVIGDSELAIQNEQEVKIGDMITTGTPLMQDVLDTRGIVSLIEFFVKELQSIYLENGLKINNKHLEIILYQMCKKFEVIEDNGNYVAGRVLDKFNLNKINNLLSARHKLQINSRQLIYGITNAALESISFLSSASFQETINVVTWSGLTGAEDDLVGIKSSIIAGTIIKAGTGFALDTFNKMADDLIQDMEETTAKS